MNEVIHVIQVEFEKLDISNIEIRDILFDVDIEVEALLLVTSIQQIMNG